MITSARIRALPSLALCSLLAACGGSPPPQEQPAPGGDYASVAKFVLTNIEGPTDGSEAAVGSAASRTKRLKAIAGPAYDKKFDLSELPAYQPQHEITGTIRFWGNNYIRQSGLADAWLAEFKKFHPKGNIDFVLPTAAIATSSLYYGLSDIAMTHEPTFYDYLSHVRILGFEPTPIIAMTGSYDAIGWMNSMAIVVHKDNPLTQITMEQLDGVFGSVRSGGWVGQEWHPEFARGADKNIRSWGQLGLQGEWKNRHITPYGYAVTYSTAQEFSRAVLQSSNRWNGDLVDFGNVRTPDGKTELQAAQIYKHLKADPGGIAYIRYNKNFPAEDLKVLKLAKTAADPYVEFTLDNVQNRSYPLTGEMNMWVSLKPGEKLRPDVRELLRFILSREAQNLVQEVDRKYLPLTAEVVRKELARVEAL